MKKARHRALTHDACHLLFFCNRVEMKKPVIGHWHGEELDILRDSPVVEMKEAYYGALITSTDKT